MSASGFRQPEQLRERTILWQQRLGGAVPIDHPVRQVESLLRSQAFAALNAAEWSGLPRDSARLLSRVALVHDAKADILVNHRAHEGPAGLPTARDVRGSDSVRPC